MDSSLSQFISEATHQNHLRVEDDFGDGFVRLNVDEAERRQAKHDIRSVEDALIELLRNARDAHAHQIFVATHRSGNVRSLTIIDDGDGIPETMHEKIFEARVTSKLDSVHFDVWGIHGRGMALFAIEQNMQSARVAQSAPGRGSALICSSDVANLSEKRDQSSYPTLVLTDQKTYALRGPRNIHRVMGEFAYNERETCRVYEGSEVEIAAVLYHLSTETYSLQDRTFSSEDSIPLCMTLGWANDPADFAHRAGQMGLEISERSARRIMDGQIALPESITKRMEVAFQRLQTSHTPRRSRKTSTSSQSRTTRIDSEDIALFKTEIQKSFSQLAEANFLVDDVDISCKIDSDGIHLFIPTIPSETL